MTKNQYDSICAYIAYFGLAILAFVANNFWLYVLFGLMAVAAFCIHCVYHYKVNCEFDGVKP